MKKVFLLVIAIFIIFSFVIALEKEEIILEVNQEGEIRQKIEEDEWRTFTESEILAYENSGKEFPVDLSIAKFEQMDFFHYRSVQEYTKVIEFNDGKFETINKADQQYGKKEFTAYKIFLFGAIFFMLISNIFMVFGKSNIVAFSAVVAAVSVAVAAVSVAATAVSVAAVFAFSDAVSVAATKNNKAYKILTAIFYVLVVIALFI